MSSRGTESDVAISILELSEGIARLPDGQAALCFAKLAMTELAILSTRRNEQAYEKAIIFISSFIFF